MTDAQYVLCRWEKRLWPAKVTAFGLLFRGLRRTLG